MAIKINNQNDWSKRKAYQVKAILNDWGVEYNTCKNHGDGITFEIDNTLYENRLLIHKAGFILLNISLINHDKGTIFKCA